MAIRRCWFIEEIELEGGGVGHRQTVMEFESTTGQWIRPDARIAAGGEVYWDNIMDYMSDINGKNRSWIINPVRLMDYCNFKITGQLRPALGKAEGTLPVE